MKQSKFIKEFLAVCREQFSSFNVRWVKGQRLGPEWYIDYVLLKVEEHSFKAMFLSYTNRRARKDKGFELYMRPTNGSMDGMTEMIQAKLQESRDAVLLQASVSSGITPDEEE
jgi:hypothetical protein